MTDIDSMDEQALRRNLRLAQAELARWQLPPGDRLQAVKEQYDLIGSRAAASVYITALEHTIQHMIRVEDLDLGSLIEFCEAKAHVLRSQASVSRSMGWGVTTTPQVDEEAEKFEKWAAGVRLLLGNPE